MTDLDLQRWLAAQLPDEIAANLEEDRFYRKTREHARHWPELTAWEWLHVVSLVETKLKWEQRRQYHGILADVSGFSCCEADTPEETQLDWNCRICHATWQHRTRALMEVLK